MLNGESDHFDNYYKRGETQLPMLMAHFDREKWILDPEKVAYNPI